MKKKVIAMLLALGVIAATLAGCADTQSSSSADDSAQTADSGSGEKYVIGMAIATYDDQWLSYMVDGMEAYAKENSDEFEFKFVDAQNDSSIQLGQIEEFIASEVDAIVVNPVETESSAPITDACKEAGIPVVSVNRPFANQDDALSYVGGDSKLSGTLIAEYMAEQNDYKGKVVVLEGTLTHEAAVLRTEGIEEAIAQYPDMEIVYKQTCDWQRAEAISVMEDFIQSGQEFDIVIGECDEIMIGACLAMDSAGIEYGVGKDVQVGGIDGTPDGLEYLKSGKSTGDVFQDAIGQAEGSMDAAMAGAKGETEDVQAENLIPYMLITPDEADEYLALWE
ncbi:MAG: substrate-binding domain-containing protein [Lachnospiraceae bacterium]